MLFRSCTPFWPTEAPVNTICDMKNSHLLAESDRFVSRMHVKICVSLLIISSNVCCCPSVDDEQFHDFLRQQVVCLSVRRAFGCTSSILFLQCRRLCMALIPDLLTQHRNLRQNRSLTCTCGRSRVVVLL